MARSRTWFVRLKGTVLGPLSSAEVKLLIRRGGIQPDTPISLDCRRWSRARKLKGIEFPDASRALVPAAASLERKAPGTRVETTPPRAVPPPEPIPMLATTRIPDPLPKEPEQQPTTATEAIFWSWSKALPVVMFVIMISFQFLARPGVRQFLFGTASSTASPAEATLAYWTELRRQTATLATLPKNASAVQAQVFLQRLANRIRTIPSAGVDGDAVTCGLTIAGTFDDVAFVVQRNNSGEVLVGGLFRIAQGDFFGPVLESVALQGEAEKRWESMEQNVGNTRAILSQRYRMEFPAL